MGGLATGQKQTTYLVMFSLFLKLLGFFVVLFSYAQYDPMRTQAVEQSLHEQFNININLPMMHATSGKDQMSPMAVQNAGRSYDQLTKELKTQIDFLSTETDARRGVLTLSVPANLVLQMDGQPAKSPGFATSLVDTLKKNQPEGAVYRLQIIAKGSQHDAMMRSVGDFVQSLVAYNYAPRYLTIGFEDAQDATVDFVVQLGPK